jgi:hypothetical protein
MMTSEDKSVNNPVIFQNTEPVKLNLMSHEADTKQI